MRQGSEGVSRPLLGIALVPGQAHVGVLRAARRRLPPRLQLHSEALREEDGGPVEACAAALQRALQRLEAAPARAAMALPDSAVAERRLELPAGLTEIQRETALRAESQGLLPHPPEELLMDYRISGGGQRAQRAHLAVCRRALCEQLQAAATGAGLRLQRIGVAGQAQRRGRDLLQQRRVRVDDASRARAPTAALELCCGLTADEGFNFLPWRRRRRRRLRRRLALGLALAAAIAQLPTAAGVWQWRQARETLQVRAQARELQRGRLRAEGAALRKNAAQYATLRARNAAARGWGEQNRNLLRLLAELPALLPDGARLQRLTLHGEQLQLWGGAGSAEQVARLLQRLGEGGLTDAQLSVIRAAEEPADGRNFSLRARLGRGEDDE